MISKSGNLDSADLTQKKAELKLKHKKQLAQFDKETEEMLVAADVDAIPSLEVKHAHQRLELRERQLNELAGSMKNLISKDDLIQQYAEQAEKATAAANDFRQRTMFDMAQKIEDIKNTRKAKDDEQRIAMEEEVRKLEEQLEREREAEALREAEKEADLDSDRKRRKQEKDEAEKVCLCIFCLFFACFFVYFAKHFAKHFAKQSHPEHIIEFVRYSV